MSYDYYSKKRSTKSNSTTALVGRMSQQAECVGKHLKNQIVAPGFFAIHLQANGRGGFWRVASGSFPGREP